MPDEIPNLWPADIGGVHARLTPLAILRQQAINLGDRTQNLVKGVVESQQVAGTTFEHTFVLVAPLLGFRFALFHVRHGIQPYPVQLWQSEHLAGKRPGSFETIPVQRLEEGEFIPALADLLASEPVRKVVDSFLAQSTFDNTPTG